MRRGLIVVIALLLVAGLAGAIAVEDAGTRSQATRGVTTTAPTTSTTTTATTLLPTTVPPSVNAVATDTRLVVTPTGVIAPVQSVNPDGTVTVHTPCENSVAVRGAVPPGPFTVVLDPGHGGSEPGAVGANGLSEKTLNLAVTKHVERALIAAGVSVVLTARRRLPHDADGAGRVRGRGQAEDLRVGASQRRIGWPA